jgi:excisionase family DNA binding protein
VSAPRATHIPRLTLTPQEAADVLGMSRDFFDQHVRDDLRVVRKGRLVLVPWAELERWVDENSEGLFA